MNSNDIQRSLRLLDYDSYEIRVINSNRPFIPSQLIHSFSDLLPICQQHDAQANIYIGVNERNKINATKEDIDAVNFVIIDLDSERPDKNQPANQQELDATIEASEVIADFFVTQGFQPPIRAISGNGCHIWVRIPRLPLTSLEMTEQWESRVKQFYLQIESVLTDDLRRQVEIDSIQDVPRIIKLIGTTSVKNNPTVDRPNRVSYWLDDPESIAEDSKLFDYLQAITVDPSLLKSKSKFVSAPGIAGDISDLADINATQLTTLKRAMNSYHVREARKRIDESDLSKSDYAFLKELAREGILDRQIWRYALITTPDTKYCSNQNLAYVETTVNNLWKTVSASGIFLDQAQKQLEQEFDSVDLNAHQVIVCEASIGTGKTHNAIRIVRKAVEQNTNVLILVPTHALASEWETRLDLGETKSVVRLHGISSPEVNCPNKSEADQLMSKGHSTLFRQKYCHSCEQRDQCKHFQSLDQAADSNILIAQHKHLNMFPQFLRNQHNNHDRTLLMIDETPELVNLEKISSDDIKTNLNLFQQINQQADNPGFSNLIEILTEIRQAHHQRTDLDLSDQIIQQLRHLDFGQLNQVVSDHYLANRQKPEFNNLLWHLLNMGVLKPTLIYRKDEDVMTYRWTPNFNNKTAFILSGTLKSEYVEKQINRPVVGIAQNWTILRNNLKIVQLVASMNGRKSVEKAINSGEFEHKQGKLFRLMLEKHQGQAIALVCSLGERGSFKSILQQALQPVADDYGIEVVKVRGQLDDETPSGIKQIPLFHWGMKGLDRLKGKYQVIWEINGHYYGDEIVRQNIRDKFGLDTDQIGESKFRYSLISDFMFEQEYKTQNLVWDHPVAKMEVEHSQVADMIQTEGRFLREDQVHKTIYRTHNVKMKPEPTRIYQTWKVMFEQEFNDQVDAVDLLTKTERNILNWIKVNRNQTEFTTKEVSEQMEMDQDNIRKYLNRMVEVRVLKRWEKGRKNLYQLTSAV